MVKGLCYARRPLPSILHTISYLLLLYATGCSVRFVETVVEFDLLDFIQQRMFYIIKIE
jgi:hypothetical protein